MKKTLTLLSLVTAALTFAQTTNDTITTKTIEEVTVSGKKVMVERKVDRLIYNVANTMVANGNSGIEVLASTPLIKVDENNGIISMVGKSGLAVMVNERMLNLSGAELLNYIKNLRSEDILKIEIITTPPAKYEAQGNSGILNIVLKSNQNLGWNGYLNSYYRQSTYGGFGGGGALNFQNNKLKASIKLRGYDEEKKSVENYQIIGAQSSKSRDERRDMNDGIGINASLEYDLSEKATIGAVYNLSQSQSNMDIVTNDEYFVQSQSILKNLTLSEHRRKTPSHTINLYYDQKLGDHKLSFGANYYDTNPIDNTHLLTTNMLDSSVQNVKNSSDVRYKILSGQSDLTLNLKSVVIETGIKLTQFDNNSDIKYMDLKDGQYLIDETKSNLFNYDEKNYATYFSLTKTFNEKWSTKFGLRYEYSVIEGVTPNSGSKTENEYGKLFPTAYLSYKINDNNQISINYSKRINRPNFRAINPYRWYSNPNSYFAGNPETQPSYNHNLEFNYIFKNKWSANLFYQKTINAFGQITQLDDILAVSTYHNYYDETNYGVNLNYTDTFFKIWESNLSASLSDSKMQVTKFNATPKNGNSFYYSTNNTLQLNKAGTLHLFFNYWQTLASRSNHTISKSSANLSAGFKLSLIEKNLLLNLSFNDIFRQAGYRGSVYFDDNVQSFNNYWDARRLMLSVTYNFGNKKVRSSNKAIDFSDRNRAQ